MREEVFCKQTSTIDITANMIMLSEWQMLYHICMDLSATNV